MGPPTGLSTFPPSSSHLSTQAPRCCLRAGALVAFHWHRLMTPSGKPLPRSLTSPAREATLFLGKTEGRETSLRRKSKSLSPFLSSAFSLTSESYGQEEEEEI